MGKFYIVVELRVRFLFFSSLSFFFFSFGFARSIRIDEWERRYGGWLRSASTTIDMGMCSFARMFDNQKDEKLCGTITVELLKGFIPVAVPLCVLCFAFFLFLSRCICIASFL